MRPSAALCARLRFTTKEVGKGFYRGNRTGSVGAHTQYGGYRIDWRKVRHFVVPKDLAEFDLTPFVTKEMEPTSRMDVLEDGTRYTPPYVDGMRFLRQWKDINRTEYEEMVQAEADIDIVEIKDTLIDETSNEAPEELVLSPEASDDLSKEKSPAR